jgi:hypothetical protein
MKNKKLSDYLVALEFNEDKNQGFLPNEVASQSSKKYWWRCQQGHEWQASCNIRIGKGRNCPYCSNQKVCSDNCLAVLFPNVANEWHPIKNNVTPYDIIAGTAKHYWWKCQKGHEWKASCVKRTRMNRGCPICKESHGEKEVRNYLEKNDIFFDFQVKFKTCRRILPLVFDFVVYKGKDIYCIEYQGEQHYKQVKHFKNKINLVIERDDIKRRWCQDNNIKLLEISYLDYKNIDSILNDFLK